MAAQPLLDAGCITEDYVQAMQNMVEKYGAYIVVCKGVALAHARPESGVLEQGLTVMTLKTPVNFGSLENDPVKLVFCLAAKDSNAHIDIMRSLVSVINEEWKIDKLTRQKSCVDFQLALKELEQAE